jgi:Nucleotidyltransferase domain
MTGLLHSDHCASTISLQAKEEIFRFVDQVVPPGCVSVWLCGSRAKGSARPDSDWDVVAFHPDGPRNREEIFVRGTQDKEHSQGGNIQLVIAHPDFWHDLGQYFSDLRVFGLWLR